MDKFICCFLLFICCSCLLQAQDDQKRPVSSAPFFIDADIGTLVIIDDYGAAFAHWSLGAGYRINPRKAIGLEYRWAYSGASYYSPESGRGVGITYRYTNKGLFVKTAIGVELKAKKENYESVIIYDAVGGSFYHNLTLGCRFRSGIFLGISGTGFFNRIFKQSAFILSPEYATEYDETGEFPFVDVRQAPEGAGNFVPQGERTFNFYAPTLTIGYAFPGQGKKKTR